MVCISGLATKKNKKLFSKHERVSYGFFEESIDTTLNVGYVGGQTSEEQTMS